MFSIDDYFNAIMGEQISSKLVTNKNASYLRPNIDSLVESINLIITSPEKYGGKSSHGLVSDKFSVKKSVQKLFNEINS